MSQTNPVNYIIQSKIDGQQFEADQNIINASVLLKNSCELTKITKPIIIDCSSESLKIFITLISNYQKIYDAEHDRYFKNSLYENLSDEQLIELIQDLCKLDSDIFLDSIADFILSKMDKMTSTEIQEYLGLEDDFSPEEKEIIDKNKTEFFLSIKIDGMEFPFPNKPLYSMKTKFSTPFNALIARIIQRSDESISYRLSMINKSIKNEIDRHPLKVTKFSSSWTSSNTYISINIYKSEFPPFYISMNTEKHDEKYFNVIQQRKIMAEKFKISYHKEYKNSNAKICENEISTRCSSFDFVLPKNQSTQADVTFFSNSNLMYKFDVTKFSIPYIFFEFCNSSKDFEKEFKEIYDHLIAKDFSKKVMLLLWGFVIFHRFNNIHRFFKKPNSSKFHHLVLKSDTDFYPEFGTFVTNYMDDNGIINSEYKIKEIPKEKYKKIHGKYYYTVSVIKEYLEKIIKTA